MKQRFIETENLIFPVTSQRENLQRTLLSMVKTSMRFSIFCCTLLSLILLSDSCSKPGIEHISPGVSASGITVENGCLAFSNNTEFEHFIDQTQNLQYEEAITWNSQFSGLGFNSMRSQYLAAKEELNQIQEQEKFEQYLEFKNKWQGKVIFEDSIYNIKPLINLPFLSNLINSKGMVKIGSRFARFYDNAVALVEENRFDDLLAIESIPDNFSCQGVEVITILRTKPVLKSNDQSIDRDQTLASSASTNGSNNGSKRITASLEVVTLTISSSVITKSEGCGGDGKSPFYRATFRDRLILSAKSEEKKWWGWKDYPSTLTLHASGTINETMSNTSANFNMNPNPFPNSSEVVLSNSYFNNMMVAYCPGTPYANFIFGPGTEAQCASTAISVAFGI